MPDLTKEFLLDCDASDYCVAAVLGQLGEDGKEHPIAYASKVLAKSEQNYSVSKKEHLAIVFGLLKFKQLILGQEVKVRTDHQPITGAGFNSRENALIYRWKEQIADINYTITYRPGKSNTNADFLSRPDITQEAVCPIRDISGNDDQHGRTTRQLEQDASPRESSAETRQKVYTSDEGNSADEAEESQYGDIWRERGGTTAKVTGEGDSATGAQARREHGNSGGEQTVSADITYPSEEEDAVRRNDTVEENELNISEGWVKRMQKKSEAIAQVMEKMRQSEKKPSHDEMENWNEEAWQIGRQWKRLKITHEILWFKSEQDQAPRAVIPKEEYDTICKWAHNEPAAGHYGVNKTLKNITRKCYWPEMKSTITRWVTGCKQCKRTLPKDKSNRAPLQPIISGRPNAIVAIDVADMGHTTSRGNRYFVMAIDHFTRWPEAWPCTNQTAETIARLFVANWVARNGVPSKLISDQGRAFTGRVFQSMCNLLGIRKVQTSPYHAQTDGKCEKAIGILKRRLKTADMKEWDEVLPLALLAMRANICDSTGISPAKMTFGRELHTPFEANLELPIQYCQEQEVPEFVKAMEENIQSIHRQARKAQEKAAASMKKRYDRHSSSAMLAPGTRAWLEFPGFNTERPKRVSVKVLEVRANNNYRVIQEGKDQEEIVNRCRLIPYDNREAVEETINEEDNYNDGEYDTDSESSQYNEIQFEEEENSMEGSSIIEQQEIRNDVTQTEEIDQEQTERRSYPKRENRRPPQRYGFPHNAINYIKRWINRE